MRPEFSTYLDALRLSAALAVVISHFTFPEFIAGVTYQGSLAGVAVTIFFVLSGYVIAYVANQKERSLKLYAVSRLARIYSVAIPALILTLGVDFYLIRHGVGNNLPLYEYQSLWKYVPVFLAFGSEIAGFHAPVFGNGVFWSLSYEVWYYITFGAFFYLRGWRRLVLGGAALLLLGVPALIYFPIWLLGCAIYGIDQRIVIGQRTAALGALLTAASVIGLLVTGGFGFADDAMNSALNNWPRTHLHNSMNFPSHYIAGLLVAAHIFFVRYCALTMLSGLKTRAAVVYLASFTFAIYLAHRPLMNVLVFLTGHDPHSPRDVTLLLSMVLAGCWCFGQVSEKKKEAWRMLFRRMLGVPKLSLPGKSA